MLMKCRLNTNNIKRLFYYYSQSFGHHTPVMPHIFINDLSKTTNFNHSTIKINEDTINEQRIKNTNSPLDHHRSNPPGILFINYN